MTNKLIPNFKVVPTKKEISTAVNDFFEDPDKPLIEKFVLIKTIENVCKQALKVFDRAKVIDSALEQSEGATNFNFMNCNVVIIKENIKETIQNYQFSEELEALRNKNTIKVGELKTKSDALKKAIRDREVHEINSGIATEITETLTGEPEAPKQTLKVILPK